MLSCFLCGGKDNLKLFDTPSFEPCVRMKIFRKWKRFKYGDLEFPLRIDNAAYHVICRSKFLSLPAKYLGEYNSLFDTKFGYTENVINKSCFLCGGKEYLKTFDKTSFEPIVRMKIFRKWKHLKYGDLEFPERFEDAAFHVGCRKEFFCLQAEYHEEYNALFNIEKEGASTSTASSADEDVNNEEEPGPGGTIVHVKEEEDIEIEECTLPEVDIKTEPFVNYLEEAEEEGKVVALPEETGEIMEGVALPEETGEIMEGVALSEETEKIREVVALPEENREDVALPKETEEETEDDVLSEETDEEEENFEQVTIKIVPSSPSSVKPRREGCIFCSNISKILSGRSQILLTSTNSILIDGLQKQAEILGETYLARTLSDCTSFKYHTVCLTNFRHEYVTNSKDDMSEGRGQELRNSHKKAFEILKIFIDREIIENDGVYFLNDLHAQYKTIFFDLNSSLSDEYLKNYLTWNLQKKILKTYDNRIVINAFDACEGKKIIYKRGSDLKKVLSEYKTDNSVEGKKFANVAYNIRNAVKSKELQKIADDVEGECDIPDMLMTFMSSLIRGPAFIENSDDDDGVKIKSLCQDLICLITNDEVRPSKQSTLGPAVNALHNDNEKVVNISNRHGHSISYEKAVESKTRLLHAASSENGVSHPGTSVQNTVDIHQLSSTENNSPSACSEPGTSSSIPSKDDSTSTESKRRRLV